MTSDVRFRAYSGHYTRIQPCLLLAQSGHHNCPDERPLLGVKRTRQSAEKLGYVYFEEEPGARAASGHAAAKRDVKVAAAEIRTAGKSGHRRAADDERVRRHLFDLLNRRRVWDLGAPEDLFEIYAKGTVRAAMVLSKQPPGNLAAIHSALTVAVREQFACGDRWRVPVPAALVRATA